ncbi:chorismate mutase [Paludibacterium yongneupense]|uniref:chorismate mutase n=1 Tax=Paludibacterium yongneupense TaxID=400061 RepID=UPI00041C35C7|nr:chorismate mutase [Paludibacterium yongneupense]
MDARQFESLVEVRLEIDRIDRMMMVLLAQRGHCVRQAARFKKTAAEVPAPDRVARVIENVTRQAAETGADPTVAAAVWRAMIAAFIDSELAEHAALQSGETGGGLPDPQRGR